MKAKIVITATFDGHTEPYRTHTLEFDPVNVTGPQYDSLWTILDKLVPAYLNPKNRNGAGADADVDKSLMAAVRSLFQ